MTTIHARLEERKGSSIPGGMASRSLYVQRAENAFLWDVSGKRYIDFAAGIAVLNTGHRHPAIIEAVTKQLEQFTHSCFNISPFENYIKLAERLNALTPGSHDKKTILLTTGAEAVENAVKIARSATGRPAVISFGGAFHGRTLLGMALTGKMIPYKRGFGPFPADIYHAVYPNAYRGIDARAAADSVKQLFQTDVDPQRVAAIIIEPVQGEGGFNIAPSSFLQEIRQICTENGILMIADEIQTGIARTGRMFAVEHSNVVPDLITTAKGLGGGFPISAVTGRSEIMDSVSPGGLGGTYGGNPVSIAAAHAVLDTIENEGLCAKAKALGELMLGRLRSLSERNSIACIGDVRGIGAMVALELVKHRDTKEPAPELTASLVTKAQENGLILLSCGTQANVIRLLAPLTIDLATASDGLDIIESSLAEIAPS
jgi:4-aminobutyrate aminotransferase